MAPPCDGGQAADEAAPCPFQHAVSSMAQPQWVLSTADIELAEKAGEGATAVVYRAVWQGRDVAVKEMHTKRQRNLTRELEILQKVKHPNLIAFVGVAHDHLLRKAQIVIEFCAGGTAFELLHESDVRLAWHQKEKIALDVSRAMQYLHSFEPEIIHRDLKSLNLLLKAPVVTQADQPVVKVTDFGKSRTQVSGMWSSPMTKLAGTCQWMAPEVFSSSTYGHKVDVYSYGMILYEVICQEVPFRGVPEHRLAAIVVQGQRPELAAVPSDCPEVLLDLMVECWAQEEAARPNFFEVSGALLVQQSMRSRGLLDLAQG